VCPSHGHVLQKWLNWSRCCLGEADSCGSKEPLLDVCHDTPWERAILWVVEPTEWSFVSLCCSVRSKTDQSMLNNSMRADCNVPEVSLSHYNVHPVSHYKPAAKMQRTTDTQLKLKRYDKLTTYQSVWQGTGQTVQISPAIQSQVTKLNSSSIFADSRATQSINGNNITVLLYATKMHPSNKDISTWIRRQVTTKSKPTAFLSQLLITHPII